MKYTLCLIDILSYEINLTWSFLKVSNKQSLIIFADTAFPAKNEGENNETSKVKTIECPEEESSQRRLSATLLLVSTVQYSSVQYRSAV